MLARDAQPGHDVPYPEREDVHALHRAVPVPQGERLVRHRQSSQPHNLELRSVFYHANAELIQNATLEEGLGGFGGRERVPFVEHSQHRRGTLPAGRRPHIAEDALAFVPFQQGCQIHSLRPAASTLQSEALKTARGDGERGCCVRIVVLIILRRTSNWLGARLREVEEVGGKPVAGDALEEGVPDVVTYLQYGHVVRVHPVVELPQELAVLPVYPDLQYPLPVLAPANEQDCGAPPIHCLLVLDSGLHTLHISLVPVHVSLWRSGVRVGGVGQRPCGSVLLRGHAEGVEVAAAYVHRLERRLRVPRHVSGVSVAGVEPELGLLRVDLLALRRLP